MMPRQGIGAAVALAAVLLGALSVRRGQAWIGVCLIVLGVLRAGTMAWKPRRKAEPEIRLGISDDDTDGK